METTNVVVNPTGLPTALPNLSAKGIMAVLQALTDNFYSELGVSVRPNGYYGLHSPLIEGTYGSGFSKCTQEQKVDLIRLLAARLPSGVEVTAPSPPCAPLHLPSPLAEGGREVDVTYPIEILKVWVEQDGDNTYSQVVGSYQSLLDLVGDEGGYFMYFTFYRGGMLQFNTETGKFMTVPQDKANSM